MFEVGDGRVEARGRFVEKLGEAIEGSGFELGEGSEEEVPAEIGAPSGGARVERIPLHPLGWVRGPDYSIRHACEDGGARNEINES